MAHPRPESVTIGTDNNLYSLTYNGTRLYGIASGFSMTLTGKSVAGMKDVFCTSGEIKDTLGTKKGLCLSTGIVETKVFSGESITIVDPLVGALGKTIILQTQSESEINKFEKSVSDDNHRVRFLRREDFESKFRLHLMKGDINAFIKDVIGDLPVAIVNKTPSKIMVALNGKNAGLSFTDEMDPQQITANLGIRNPMTVGDILGSILPMFGLELYYAGEDLYLLEEPRIVADNPGSTQGIISIQKKDIIEWNSRNDPYNIPDIMVPSFDHGHTFTAGKNSAVLSGELIKHQMDSLAKYGKNGGTGGFKIKTYQVPNMLTGILKDGSQKRQENHRALKRDSQYDSSVLGTIESFFGQYAMSSSFYGLNSGTVRTIFNPKIQIPYSWYNIDGKICYVSNIYHNVTRDSAETVLTIAGIYEKNSDLPPPSSNSAILAKLQEAEKDQSDRMDEDTDKEFSDKVAYKEKMIASSAYRKKEDRLLNKPRVEFPALAKFNESKMAELSKISDETS